MNDNSDDLFIDETMLDLFRVELENQTTVLNQGLIDLEQNDNDPTLLEALMRAAHSIKGASRVVRMEQIVRLAHIMEDCFVAAQHKKLELDSVSIDKLLACVDFLAKLSKIGASVLEPMIIQSQEEINKLIVGLEQIIAKISSKKADDTKVTVLKGQELQKGIELKHPEEDLKDTPPSSVSQTLVSKNSSDRPPSPKPVTSPLGQGNIDRVLRVTAYSLNRLMGLAGESLVESRWLNPFSESLIKIKKSQIESLQLLEQVTESLRETRLPDTTQQHLINLQSKNNDILQQINDRLAELDLFIARHSSLSDRLYREVIDSRMRPFADGVEAFPRMIRDLARQLNKRVKLEIIGKNTSVDRDILEKLEVPLGHLLRNAVDHGIETPEERVAAGKNPEGVIRLEAMHRAGMLAITVSDDGRGIDIEALRKRIVKKNLVKDEIAAKMTPSELLDFLFLPGFSTAREVTEVSGRGVGLNIVQNMVQEVSGSIRVETRPKEGVTFFLQLPLTLSVIRSLIVEISGEPYAFPLARLERSVLLDRKEIELIENRQYFHFEGTNVGLIPAWQVLNLTQPTPTSHQVPVVILSDRSSYYGLVVDKFMGEKELVVQELDPRLGKVADITAGAFLEDGKPVLIIDVEDMMRSTDLVLSGGRIEKLHYSEESGVGKKKKRILVIDDSITVREVECRLLRNQGYEVETAVNGVDGWNAVRVADYDLVVTDIDMPRMNGIELIKAIRSDARLKGLPILIVSYKEREEDRVAGLEAGANCYLTKSSFHDESLIHGVKELIGVE